MHTIRGIGRASGSTVLAFLLIALLIAACGSGSSAGASAAPAVQPDDQGAPAAAGASAPARGEDTGNGNGNGNGQAPAPSGGTNNPDGVGAALDAKIIRTGTMDLEVTDLNKAVSTARNAILGMGGYVGASATSNIDDQPYAEITYRIPVDRWEDALDTLRGLNGLTNKVVAEQTQAVDVTGQVVDLDARIRNLQASETSLQTIASSATRITDLLEIQAQITQVRGQIEQLEAQRNDLGDRTAYGTMTARFQLPAVAVIEVQAEGWDAGAIFAEASASLLGLMQTLAGAGIWLVIVWVPVILIVALVVGLFAWLLRRFGVIERPLRPAPPARAGE